MFILYNYCLLIIMVVYVDLEFYAHVVVTCTLIVSLRTCAPIYFLLYICMMDDDDRLQGLHDACYTCCCIQCRFALLTLRS